MLERKWKSKMSSTDFRNRGQTATVTQHDKRGERSVGSQSLALFRERKRTALLRAGDVRETNYVPVCPEKPQKSMTRAILGVKSQVISGGVKGSV